MSTITEPGPRLPAGDLDSLSSHGLPAERVELEADPAEAVRALTERITATLQEN